MTSRDLTENVEQLQIRRSLELVHAHGVAVVARLAERAVLYRDLVMAGRSHNVAAQATTLGKRFASAAEETLLALTRLRELIDRYPLRGIKGPMGTAQDMLDLFDGDTSRLADLERRIAEFLGFTDDFHQRRAGVSALAGPRRACRRWCSWARARRRWRTPSG